MEAELVEGVEFSGSGPGRNWGDTVFRHCSFEDIDSDGLNFDGVMIGCTLSRVQAYWGLFNTATIVNVTFQDCVFPGTSFRGCTLVSCTFLRCRFVRDNLGGSCTVDGCMLTECRFEACEFEHRQGRTQSIFTADNRYYGCKLVACRGLAGVRGLTT